MGPDVGAYRDAEEGLRGLRGELIAARRRELKALVPRAKRIYTRRVARQVFGAVLLAGTIALMGGTVLDVRGAGDLVGWTWLVAIGAYVFTRAFAAARLGRLLEERFVLSGHVHRDVDKLERLTPLRVVRELSEPHETRSIWLPVAGITFLAPITLHLLVVLVFSRSRFAIERFEDWTSILTVTTGPAFLLLAWLSVRFARKVRARSLNDVRYGQAADGWEAYGLTVGAAAIWSVCYVVYHMMVPSLSDETARQAGVAIAAFVVLSVTFLMFIPAVFSFMRGRVGDERFALGVLA